MTDSAWHCHYRGGGLLSRISKGQFDHYGVATSQMVPPNYARVKKANSSIVFNVMQAHASYHFLGTF